MFQKENTILPWIAAILLYCGSSHGTSTRIRYRIEKMPTEHVQESLIEGAPNCDVLGVILQGKVHFTLASGRQHDLKYCPASAVVLRRSLANAADRRAYIKPM